MADEKKIIAPATDEVATLEKDIDLFAGWVSRLENPDPVLRAEAAGRGLRLYDEVDRDAHAGSVIQQRIMSVVGKEWEILPAKTVRRSGRPAAASKEQIVAEYVSGVLQNCNFDQARQELLKGILYGFYNVEILWTVREGALAVSRFLGKHPRRFVFTPKRELRLLTPQNMIDGEAVPERKFVTFSFGDSDNPYGTGLGRRLWWPVWFKKHGIKFWMIFLEKFGMPTIVGKYPSGTLPAKQKELMDALEAIQSDTGIKIPNTMDISFLEASRSGKATYEQLCEYMDRQISKAVLGQTASADGTPGKFGNEDMQNDVRQELVEADADLLDECLNESLIRWIVDFNFPAVTAYPKIKTFANAKPDLTSRVTVDKTLVVDIGLPVAKAYFYETYGIPEPAPDEELVVVRASTPGAGRATDENRAEKQFSDAATTAGAAFTPDQQVVENLAAASVKAASSALAANEARILAAVQSASSYEEAMQNLLDLYPEMNMDALASVLENAVLGADLFGRWAVGEETR
jgi:phage gp29-like protein